MEALRRLLSVATKKKENVVTGLLLGTFVTLGVRSSLQQREIDALEAEKSSLRSAISSLYSSLWSCRQDLFALAAAAAADPSSSSPKQPFIPLSRLRAIYGEEEPPSNSALLPSAVDPQGVGEDSGKESISIA
ncbi:hypothetical protein B296_00021418 [Ensete ventricosum]|uniref:Uncharacterized protein n=1 Tax=Ensete ventricosum TaxID=4639 RepID=A0A426XMG1_ENSVE|nr:hypothetical protein B296_00021418 [Ensete ventricosum]